jgi:putative phage-type endonuclease
VNAEERDAWLEARRLSLGASDAPAVLGLSPWAGPWAVWAAKVLEWDAEESIAMRLGTYLEPFVAELVAERWAGFGWTLDEVAGGLMRHPTERWAHASPDRLVLIPGRDVPGVLQIKTTSHGEGWGPDGSDATPETVPGHYLLQTLWEAWVVHSTWAGYGIDEPPLAWIAVLIGSSLRVYTLDCVALWPMLQDAVARCRAWWTTHIVYREAPAVDDSADCGSVLAVLHPRAADRVELNGENAGRILAYEAATTARWAADRDAALARNQLVAALGDARDGLVTMDNGDRKLVRRSIRHGRNGATYNTISISDARGRLPTGPADEDGGIPWGALDAVMPEQAAEEKAQ